MMIDSAKSRGAALDHMLFSGPPGLGKTSLALLISKSMGANHHVISGPALEKKGDLASILTQLQTGDILFIDEIHRLPIAIEEILYSAMEDFRIDIIIGQGPSARTMRIDLNPFTLIGATTKSGMLSSPLRDRFVGAFHFEYYAAQDLQKILSINAKILGLSLSLETLNLIAQRCRGTPRIANRVLRRIRDYCVVKKLSDLTSTDLSQAFTLMDIDAIGLDNLDRKFLITMRDFYQGGPVGIESMAATLSEDRETLETVVEPYLLKEGLIIRTSRGRVLTQKSLDHLSLTGK
jgi:Holliday junction DNA helicase RuvB